MFSVRSPAERKPCKNPTPEKQSDKALSKANGPLLQRPLRLPSRHNNRRSRLLQRPQTRRSRQELPPSQQARHEVQRRDAGDDG